jgi:hypothetical protein
MVSTWWVVLAFFGGGFAGVLVMAMMHMAGDQPPQSMDAPEFDRLLL